MIPTNQLEDLKVHEKTLKSQKKSNKMHISTSNDKKAKLICF